MLTLRLVDWFHLFKNLLTLVDVGYTVVPNLPFLWKLREGTRVEHGPEVSTWLRMGPGWVASEGVILDLAVTKYLLRVGRE
jgi:hypothetical protein